MVETDIRTMQILEGSHKARNAWEGKEGFSPEASLQKEESPANTLTSVT